MSVDRDKPILVLTKGHPFDRAAFFEIFDSMDGLDWAHVEHPAAEAFYSIEQASGFGAIVAYDMPGIRFQPGGPVFSEPSEETKSSFLRLVERGFGFVFLHHAIAGWPTWDAYGELIGGRFLYQSAELRGRQRPDSGYRHGVTHEVRVLADHPVTAGLPASFEITDELYLYEVFDDSLEPLLASNYTFAQDNFYSAWNVVKHGRMHDRSNWDHEPGNNLIGWARTQGKSRIVYLQCGDDPVAYANPSFRQLLRNAIDWVRV